MTALERLVESFFANDKPDRVGRFPFRDEHFPARDVTQAIAGERFSRDFPFYRTSRPAVRSKLANARDEVHLIEGRNGKTGKVDASSCPVTTSLFPLAISPPGTPGNGWMSLRHARPGSAVGAVVRAGSAARCCACGLVEGDDRFLAVMDAPTASWSQMHSACYLGIAGATRL